jgi:hypothetical protein
MVIALTGPVEFNDLIGLYSTEIIREVWLLNRF